MKKLKDEYFEDFYQEDEYDISAEEARRKQERADKLDELRGNLYFYSFIAAGTAIVVGGIVVLSRLVMYPIVKKFVESWDE